MSYRIKILDNEEINWKTCTGERHLFYYYIITIKYTKNNPYLFYYYIITIEYIKNNPQKYGKRVEDWIVPLRPVITSTICIISLFSSYFQHSANQMKKFSDNAIKILWTWHKKTEITGLTVTGKFKVKNERNGTDMKYLNWLIEWHEKKRMANRYN